MKILIVHNFYRQAGGEDVVFREEIRLLENAGHDVVTMTANNDEVVGGGALGDGIRSVWNRAFAARVYETVKRHGCEIAHFHNTLPVVSPASLRAARRAGAAVVATLHNYRLVCPSATLFRDGQVCESCTKSVFPWQGVASACYRGSRLATAAVGITTLTHRLLGTWRNKVDRFVALTEFAKAMFASAGIPQSKVAVKPNFVAPLTVPDVASDSVLFVGRLSAEKGIDTLLRAAALAPELSFRIAGDGPLADSVRECANELANVTWLGSCTREQIAAELGRGIFLAFPSQWYEGMPMTILEAFSAGVPVVASRCGAIPEIVSDEHNGLLFPTGDASALVRAARRVHQAPDLREQLSRAASESYESLYRPEQNLKLMEQVYADALAQRHVTRRAS